jgi:hypothetical protein
VKGLFTNLDPFHIPTHRTLFFCKVLHFATPFANCSEAPSADSQPTRPIPRAAPYGSASFGGTCRSKIVISFIFKHTRPFPHMSFEDFVNIVYICFNEPPANCTHPCSISRAVPYASGLLRGPCRGKIVITFTFKQTRPFHYIYV